MHLRLISLQVLHIRGEHVLKHIMYQVPAYHLSAGTLVKSRIFEPAYHLFAGS